VVPLERPSVDGRDAPLEEIVSVTRGDVVEVFRIRLTESGGAALERFENGEFLPARVFSSVLGPREVAASIPPAQQLERAIRHALRYLDGSVTVGERDLLSPTSALVRNLRWFPGDLQMLGTSFHYVRELFPSAQFHVTQLFRRVFGDVAFLGLILFSSACWLRTRANTRLATLALLLQLASMVAIIGFDRFWEPIRYRWRKIREVRAPKEGLGRALRLAGVVASQLVQGLVAVTINTLIGLTNLLINPAKILLAYQKVRRGKSLEWKASSVSAGQDMRGWPVSEFLQAYGGAAKVGVVMLLFLSWLVLLGAPLDLFGLNSVGIFLASFLTAWFYAWYAALPHSAENGAPHYELSRREFWGLTLTGGVGFMVAVGLFGSGLYPMPAFEASTAYLALFLFGTCVFAAAFPSYYALKRRRFSADAGRPSGASRARRTRFGVVMALSGMLMLALLAVSPTLRARAKHFFVAEEREVYASVGAALKQTRMVDPEPLLSSDGTQITLSRVPEGVVLDARELRGIPAPRPKRVAHRDSHPLPELAGLPPSARIPTNKPRRDFVLSSAEPQPRPQPAHAEHLEAVLEARRRARELAPRVLSTAELAEQAQFLEHASYPWIGRDELAKLGSADAEGASLPLLEMARVHRFDEVAALWDQVPAASEGGVAPAARFARLLDGVDGAVSLGLEPSVEHVRAFVAAEREVSERWRRAFPEVPLGAVRESVAGTPGGAFQVARHALLYGLTFDELARRLRLDYVNEAWNQPPIAPRVRQIFRDRVDVEARDRLELDWGESEEARARFQGLQTEQLVASKALGSALGTTLPSLEQLRSALQLIEGAIAPASTASSGGLAAALARTFRVEGSGAVEAGGTDSTAELLRTRLWAQTMSGRLGQIAARVAADSPFPGDANDRALLSQVSQQRFPSLTGDSRERQALDWLLLVDASETYRELADGYDRFQRELAERGVTVAGGLTRAPALSSEELWRDLLLVWRELPGRYPNIPVQSDQVGEFICQTAYFSTADGKRGRTPGEFVHDFASVFADVNRLMPTAPPPMAQELTDAASVKTQGRLSRSPEARRFFAWWSVAALARVIEYNAARHGQTKPVVPESLAEAWADLASSGLARWPHLPWRAPGFSEYFLNLQQVAHSTRAALWQRFELQLNRAEALSARHVVPSPRFEALVERRISEKTGAPNFDPVTRRANATLALAELSDAAAQNNLRFDEARSAKLGEMLARLYEKVARDYQSLHWEGEGIVESYLMSSLVNGWDFERTLREFQPEWSLANTLARAGLLVRFDELASSEPSRLSPEDRNLRAFIDTQAARLARKTGAAPESAKARAMNALVALASLVLSAGEEGLLPVEHGEAWSKERVRRWALLTHSRQLDGVTGPWALALARDFGELSTVMRAQAPEFAWDDGAFVETELLVARSSGVSMSALQAARLPTWRAASSLAARRWRPPEAFVQLVAMDSRIELKQKLAAARGKDLDAVSDAEVRALEEPELQPQNAVLVLADVLAQIQVSQGVEPDPTELSRKLVGVRNEGPRRYPNVPWSAKGFVTSLIVAAERPDFHGDVWRYAEFIELPAVDRLLGEADAANPNRDAAAAGAGLPLDVLADTRAIMTQQTGRAPSSERVVAFQALRDGLSLVKEFVPESPPTLVAAITLVRVRARVRALAERFPALHIVAGDDHSPRVGFADRLAAIATKQTLRSGLSLSEPSFAEAAVRLLETQFLHDMSRIYALVRQSFPREEIEYYKEAIARDALVDNVRKAKQSGLSPDSLSVPKVNDDDVVADFALYELLYAREIGQQPSYVVDLFEIYDKLRDRADLRAGYAGGLASLDREALAGRAAYADEQAWRNSAAYAAWWEKRGEFVKRARGKLIALSRTFALLKQAAFSHEAAPEARAAFSRFGNFDAFLSRFFDDLAMVRQTPGFAHALAELGQRDPFLADGVEFAVTEFKLHVLDGLYSRGESAAVTQRIAEYLPKVNHDYRGALGFVPGLESGVPFYDAFASFVRSEVQGGAGTDLLRRLNLVQRGLQSWTQTYFLKQAYKVLFDRDLDEEDPTRLAGGTRFHRRTLGDEVHEFLESRLPQRLARETGSHDLVVWLKWLKEKGEVDLDGRSLGKNPYAEAVAGFEQRLADYRARITAGEASGKNVRAERQRVLDLEREYGSLQHQVERLELDAAKSAGLYQAASRDYYEALWQSALWLLAILGCGVLGQLAARRLPPSQRARRRWLGAAAVALPLALGALPFWVLANPERAARLAGGPLQALRLLQKGERRTAEPRGAAAQLEKTQPWLVLARGPAAEVDR
jgi:hypothetical protein